MNVGELILELQKYDPNLPVLISGYEGGVSEKHPGGRLILVNRGEGLLKEFEYLPGEHEEDWVLKVPHNLAVLIVRDD